MSDRPFRILWACPYCLLDTSSGCSMSARELLRQLKRTGLDVYILSATIFDREAGTLLLRENWNVLQENIGKMVDVEDGELIHHIIPCKSTERYEMTTMEENSFYAYFMHVVNEFKPDLLYFYGGQILEMCMMDEATDRNIPVCAYLGNGEYSETRWCRDVDKIFTASKATSDMYFAKDGFRAVPIGVPIVPEKVVASEHTRENVLFINPAPSKGAYIVATLAYMLEKKRPDIRFEVVESRASWKDAVKAVTETLGDPKEALSNVSVTPNTSDMRPVYGRARLTLAPSLWWESFGRVATESMLNGVPCVVSNRGGLPEAIQDGGLVLELPKECYVAPYQTFVRPEHLSPVTDFIERCYDDQAFYQMYMNKALMVGGKYRVDATMNRFLEEVRPLLERHAGDQDFTSGRMRKNKQIDTNGTVEKKRVDGSEKRKGKTKGKR